MTNDSRNLNSRETIDLPSVAGLSDSEKRKLLGRLLLEKLDTLEPVFSLSHGQRGMWFHYRVNPNSAALNLTLPVRIRSAIDTAALRRACNRLDDRHASLRTLFEQRDGQLVQRVRATSFDVLEVIDATEENEEEFAASLQAAMHRPFRLETGPVSRVQLFSRADDDHVLLATIHHIIGDFWSLALLVEELLALYREECDGRRADLSRPTAPYRSFVDWQTALLESEEGERLWKYWQGQVEGVNTVLDLPLDYPRPARFTYQGGAFPLQIPAQILMKLRDLARCEGVTLYVVLLAAYQILLGRRSGQDEFLVGSPFAGSNRKRYQRTVGYFSNMLPLRVNLRGDPTLHECLQRVSQTVFAALEHQDFPLTTLVDRLNLPRDPSRLPLFQTSFTLEKSPTQSAFSEKQPAATQFLTGVGNKQFEVQGLRVEPLNVPQRTVQMDLSLLLEDSGSGLDGFLRYCSDLFDESTISQMATQFVTLLQAITEGQASRAISELPLMDGKQRERILRLEHGPHDPSPDEILHRSVERMASARPNATAVVDSERQLTYRELNQRSNHVAQKLRHLGVGPDTIVAVCLPRSSHTVVALLAVLKAGGAFVPLDPGHPVDRLRSLLAETASPVLITQQSLKSQFAGSNVTLIVVDDEALVQSAERPPELDATPNNLAYVIYTSGSTGQPKGVMVEHRAIANTIHGRQREMAVQADDTVLLTLPYVFDPCIVTIFTVLSAGATLVVAESGVELDRRRMLELIRRHKISVLQMPPSVLQRVLDGPDLREYRGQVRMVICGGEVMATALPQKVHDALWTSDGESAETESNRSRPFEVPVHNLYGPTETACDATTCLGKCGESRPRTPIGRPIANTQAYVLNAAQQRVPMGVPGELYLGGRGVARGYLHDDELTQSRFVADPFVDDCSARMYRTGDRVRWLEDGNLDFLGRVDGQIKLRGFRIEPAEIEAAMVEHPAVEAAAVVIRNDNGRGSKLVGYFETVHAGIPPSAGEMRRHANQRLPRQLVPALFVPVESLPRTSTGKVDLRLLPAPPSGRDPSQALVAPRTQLERYLADLWVEMIGVDEISIHDDFFELGGESIQAALLIDRVQQRLDEPVYTVALFDATTVSSLAHYLGELYPDAVGRLFGEESVPTCTEPAAQGLTEERIAGFRQLVRRLPPRTEPADRRNPTMVFLLSAPRSGSTLTRVMLGGHPSLFAPPELQLLNFETLHDRRQAFDTDRDRFWLDGTVRALMEIQHCTAEEARAQMAEFESRAMSVQECYGQIQRLLGKRTFVDKTPTYALDANTLLRAELDFDQPKYIHLVRHPGAVISSFEKARLQVFFPPFLSGDHSFSPRELAELVWNVSNRNILDFLQRVPTQRQLRITYEDLVQTPQTVMEQAAEFLGLEFHEEMLRPQQKPKQRMTDTINPLARMLGDVRFHEHQGIDPENANRWRNEPDPPRLSKPTRDLALMLGYEEESLHPPTVPSITRRRIPSPHQLLMTIREGGSRPAMIWVHPPGGIVLCYEALARHLGEDRPVYALRGRGAHGEGEPHETVEAMAADYVAEVLAVQPEGPFHFGGWSAGGVIALEMANQLIRQQEMIGTLALLDTNVPFLEEDEPQDLAALGPAWEYGLDISLLELARLGPERQMDYILQHARKLGIVTDDTPLHLIQQTLDNLGRLFHAHVAAVRKHTPKFFPGRVDLFQPAESLGPSDQPEDKGWNQFAQSVKIHLVPGSHYTMVKEPHARVLAERLEALLQSLPE